MNRGAVLVLAASLAGAPAGAQFEIRSATGDSSLKLGLLAQAQGEWLTAASGEHTSQNLFLRRLRVIVGGKLGERISFFVDTNSPNLGKAGSDGKKNDADVFVQDAFVSVAVRPTLLVDVGMLLLPLSHNGQQGAATLLALDYAPTTFLASLPTGSRTGRDFGAQLRGYLFDRHLELRAAVSQGARGADAAQPLRTTVRAVWYPFEADTGFFYTGTFFGAKRLLAVGASHDQQAGYHTDAVDLVLDWPVGGGGDAVTAQAGLVRYDGGATLTELPRQDTALLEASYYFKALSLGPFVQLSCRDFDDPARADERTSQIGVAWWQNGHRFNLKLGAGRIERDGAADRTQVVLQGQLFLY